MMSADERLVKADSRNLLKVDVFMIGENLNVALGGLVVSVLATGPKVRGFKPS
jgi:hypothetical protein